MSTAYQRDYLKALADRGVPFLVIPARPDAADGGLLLWAPYRDDLFDAYRNVQPGWRAIAPPSSSSPPPDLLVDQGEGSTLRMRTLPQEVAAPPPEGSIFIVTGELNPAVPFDTAYGRSLVRTIDGMEIRTPAEQDLARLRSPQAV